jgi:hypothetical protein
MRNANVYVAAVAAILLLAGGVHAQSLSLAYSFEDAGIDGFFGVGGAATSQEPDIGVTHGENSLQYDAGNGGFVGARTETVIPAALNNPPGVSHVLFDMTITDLPVDLTFADIGVTVFGHDIDGGSFGIQSQFTDTLSIVLLGVGQHLDLQIDLDNDAFTGQSFNEIFGDDVNDLDVASAFQFYISKNVGVPVTVYIDNVRLVVPEPATLSLVGLVAVGLTVFARRRR